MKQCFIYLYQQIESHARIVPKPYYIYQKKLQFIFIFSKYARYIYVLIAFLNIMKENLKNEK